MEEINRCIDSPEAMIEVVRRVGIIPFFKNPVHGWSIEEMTAPGCWWDTEGVLGPWDWKIEVVHSGAAYGKLLGDRAAFATEEWYRELMNYRRSLPKYRVALGEYGSGKKTKRDLLLEMLSKPALDAIKEQGALESKQLRQAMSEAVSSEALKLLGDAYKKLLVPSVKKTISDQIMTFLQMGTWCVVGDITRVYRGANLTYSGWQTSTNTTPEAYFGLAEEKSVKPAAAPSSMPAWAKRFMDEEDEMPQSNASLGTPEESRQRLINHIHELYPHADIADIEQMIGR